MHFRGGDKLWNECKPSSVVSCANVTLLAETAWLGVVRYGGHSKEKPVLRIMTTEPGMVEKFSEDKIGSRFQVLLMPLSDIASFFQGTFNRRKSLCARARISISFRVLLVLTFSQARSKRRSLRLGI